jgi:type I restriction enzyme M protein
MVVATIASPILHCPIRGKLKASAKAKDGPTFTEEKLRIDCIKYLLARGYPKDWIKTETVVLQFGHKGHNSLRADIVVYSCAIINLVGLSPEQQRAKIILIAEIKRDNKSAKSAKEEQLKPALALVQKKSVLGIYWDDIEQSLFFKEDKGGQIFFVEVAINHLPNYGAKFKVKPLRFNDLVPAHDLIKIFERFDDLLHQAGHDLEERYEILLQVILAKIYDEKVHAPKNETIVIQDFSVMSLDDDEVVATWDGVLSSSLLLYQKYLLKKIEGSFSIRGDTLKELSKILCRLNLLSSSPHVTQDFYMYFAKHLYKVDLAQYFTPYEVVDFIVVAAYRIAMERHKAQIADQLHGSDDGARAVQISVLNMILNGDGKTNIVKEDSLVEIKNHEDAYSVMLCNPPFGKDIVERRPSVLSKFELGRDPLTGKTHAGQETGVLFVEVCLRSASAGQRVAIIVPNGYLGNRSERYATLRSWILRHSRVVAVVGFPRFTFKKSGADVSASVLILEKRKKPIDDPALDADYPIHFNLLNQVGWDVRTKRAERVYKVSELDGSLILDENNNPIIEADFDRVLGELYRSPVIDEFPWLVDGVPNAGVSDGWAVYSSEITAEPALILDPKRHCQKYRNVVSAIKSFDHFRLGDVIDFVSSKFKRKTSNIYRYVEIEQIYENFGAYEWQEHRGWSLPGRAKHKATPGDIFVARIWSSVGKWFIAGSDAAEDNLIVTSGCYHLRIKPEKAHYLADVVNGFSTEMFRVQMRALATGSDGLSVISEDDFKEIVLPRLTDKAFRQILEQQISSWTEHGLPLAQLIDAHIKAKLPELAIAGRPSHVAQV